MSIEQLMEAVKIAFRMGFRAARDTPDDDDFDTQTKNEYDEEMAWVGYLETLLADTRELRHQEDERQ